MLKFEENRLKKIQRYEEWNKWKNKKSVRWIANTQMQIKKFLDKVIFA